MKHRKNLNRAGDIPVRGGRKACTDAFYGEARKAMAQMDAEAAYLRSKLI